METVGDSYALPRTSDGADLESLGRFVRDRRRSRRLTRAQLARRLGWDQERITALESVTRILPSLPTLAQLADALESPLSDLVVASGFPLTDAGNTEGNALDGALLFTLQNILAIEPIDLRDALTRATNLIVTVMQADTVDAFMLEAEGTSLVALVNSDTPLGRKQKELGLDRVALASMAPVARVFQTGAQYHTGQAHRDGDVPSERIEQLEIRSLLIEPLWIHGEIRGAFEAASIESNRFTDVERVFFHTVARWVSLLAQHAELVETSLRQTDEQARRLTATELVTVIAHDLHNQLTPLKGRIDLIIRRAERAGETKDRDDALQAARSIGRLQHMVTDLLDVSRLDRGVLALTPQPTDLVALARRAIEQAQTGTSRLELCAPDELIATVDPDRLGQALQNLVDNAVQHTPDGTPITVIIRPEVRDGVQCAVIAVADDGLGIPEELLPDLFSRHRRGPSSSGLGLGLALGRSIVEAHHGVLSVASVLGRGATFEIVVPIIP